MITMAHDWTGGITLANMETGQDVYFQPGDDANEVDSRFDSLVGNCGYSGQCALQIMWHDYVPE